MIFSLTRIVLWLIISFCAVFIVHKMKIKRKKIVFLLSIVFCTMLVTAISMFPIENLFISDKLPEDIFSYSNMGEIKEIIYGKESCMIVYLTNENSGGYYLIPKTDKGYKMPNYFTAQKVYDRFDGNGLFKIYNVKGTQDFYVFGTVHLKENDNDIGLYQDGKKVGGSVVRLDDTSFIYFYLPDFSNEYYLMINGEEITIVE